MGSQAFHVNLHERAGKCFRLATDVLKREPDERVNREVFFALLTGCRLCVESPPLLGRLLTSRQKGVQGIKLANIFFYVVLIRKELFFIFHCVVVVPALICYRSKSTFSFDLPHVMWSFRIAMILF